MVITKNLVSSWNFDTISGSNESGEFYVPDSVSDFYGNATSFNENDSSFIVKDYITIEKNYNFESCNYEDSINTINDDVEKINSLNSSHFKNLIIEKSMYQNVSDDMLNMFLDIYNYSFTFITSNNRYKSDYVKLNKFKKHFFDKVLNKPDLEKYVEFYKWIDSSLAYMLDQLKPETSNNINYVKNTIESHILERNKYKHILPLTRQSQRHYQKNIKVINNNSIKVDLSNEINKKSVISVSGSIDEIVNLKNINSQNYENSYEYLNVVGESNNKKILRSRFSSVDGKSDKYRDLLGQFSKYNSLLNKSREIINKYNISQSIPNEIQGKDNNFIFNNFPSSSYGTANYHDTAPNYIIIPDKEVLFRKRNNLLIDESSNTYEQSYDIVEPPIQFNVPQHYVINFEGADSIDVYATYNNQIDDFSYRNKIKSFSRLENIYAPTIKNRSNVAKDTFFYKLQQSSSYKPNINYFENLNVILPRQDKIGLSEIRTKPFYDETEGTTRIFYYTYFNLNLFSNSSIKMLPWTYDSFNNPTHKLRTFWKNSQNERLRTRGIDWDKDLNTSGDEDGVPTQAKKHYGAYNCYEYVNKANLDDNGAIYKFIHDKNVYNSIYSMDSFNDFKYCLVEDNIRLSSSKEVYGDLAPYSHINNYKINNLYRIDNLYAQPKPQFIHNLFLAKEHVENTNTKYIYNKSYQDGLDCNIIPWYNSYEDYRKNIKSVTQTYSVIPEFIVSNYSELIKDNSVKLYKTVNVVLSPETGFYTPATNVAGVTSDMVKQLPVPYYLKLYGNEKESSVRTENFKADLKNFIDKKSNKIKFKIKVVKKILPYNGFYPQQRAVQVAGIYNDVFLTDTKIVDSLERQPENPGDYSSYRVGIENTLAATQFLFSPGILFNSIKAGIAVDWPIITSSVDPYILKNNSYSLKGVDYRMPFESILKPEFYLNSLISTNKNACIIYMDPTHESPDVNYLNLTTPSEPYSICSFELKKFEDSRNKKLYHSAINNYLGEIVNFFLENKKLKLINSKTFNSPISVVKDTVYAMDLVIRKNTNFSMFNTNISGNKEDFYIPYESLFGPPSHYNGIYSHTSSLAYYPFIPPYMQDDESSRLRMVYTASADEDNLYNIMKKTEIYRVNNSSYADNGSYANRMDLRSCFNIDTLTSTEEGFTWYIQAKFESPLINFNKCSYTEVTSSDSEILIK